MRSEQEMFDLILGIAKTDERVRAVYMNGSRTNPNVQKDVYQDFDIVFVVTETKSFLNDKSWITLFGEIAIVQEPDSNDFGWGITANFDQSYTWLMLFKDDNRIDLNIQVKEVMLENYTKDSLTVPLLDKDHCLPKIPASNDGDYFIKMPTESQYKGCCNEFWWCLNNVAKGIKRDQLPYAMWMYQVVVRDMLEKMIDWTIGIENNFSVTVGMKGKYYKKYMSEDMYELYSKTFFDGDYTHLWEAIYASCALFRTTAQRVALHFDFVYNVNDDRNIEAYLNRMR